MEKAPPNDLRLMLRAAPFLKRGVSTPHLMFDVLIGLLPVVAAAVRYYGLDALLLIIACALGAALTEAVFNRDRRTLFDGSAMLTGVLLALTLPPALPLWMAVLGAIVAIGLGKSVWGGLGHNLFNPALVGRAFLQAAFPTALTTWVTPRSLSDLMRISSSTLAPPFMHGKIDALTAASPLAEMKFEQKIAPLMSLLIGNVAGSLGETSAAAILLGGIYMTARRTFDWRIPASIFLSVTALSGALYLINPAIYPAPLFMWLSGGLMFGAFFMATDPVTSPIAPRATWIFGIGIGLLVVLIRLFGGLPEGVMYAILLMNAATPLLERIGQPRPFGRKKAT